MRISDWSSDVCSSDLNARDQLVEPHLDRLLDLGTVADQRLHPFLDPPKDILLGFDLGWPLLFRLWDDIGIGRIRRHRIGTQIGIAVLGKDQCHLGQCLRSEEHTSELQSLMRISYAVFCLKKKITQHNL